jgi:hypothetical protein
VALLRRVAAGARIHVPPTCSEARRAPAAWTTSCGDDGAP